MAKVTGIGGVFFKSANPSSLAAWYKDNLGVPIESWGGAVFQTEQAGTGARESYAVWCPFKNDSTYFAPSEKPFIINFRVDNLDQLIAQLEGKGIKILGPVQTSPQGKFAWIIDPEGLKLELWEPNLAEEA